MLRFRTKYIARPRHNNNSAFYFHRRIIT